jgi:xanthine dehydrogenase YagR molybdenum-binding subunit
MPEYRWPNRNERRVLGQRVSRLDGPDKVTGKAKYNSDVKLAGTLHAKFLRCPHAHARVKSIDVSAAEKLPGVKAVRVIQGPGKVIQWSLDDVAVVAAVDEATAEDAVRRIVVEYEVMPHLVNEDDPSKAGDPGKPPSEQVKGDPDQAFQDADVVIEGEYGIPVITHCCLEPHGQVIDWTGETLTAFQSTQNVSGMANQYAQPLEIPAANVSVVQDHVGGGYGSKFGADSWGLETAKLSRQTGRPVRNFLERDAELFVAGVRPSGFARIKAGAMKDGRITAWEAESWGTSGPRGGGVSMQVLPYVINPPNVRKKHTGIATNTGPARAWRAPNHPQTCWLTFAALDDLAAKLDMDPLDFYLKNLNLTERADLYRSQLKKAAALMGWREKWHPRGQGTAGPVKQGLGLAFHTWGGRGHDSTVRLLIDPDGSVSISLGTQDIGTGTTTVIAMVAAETFGLPVNSIKGGTDRVIVCKPT